MTTLLPDDELARILSRTDDLGDLAHMSVPSTENPESTGMRGRQCREKNDVILSLFAGARQRAIARFGQEAEDLIYVKFNKDGGAAAEIIDHFGQEINSRVSHKAVGQKMQKIVRRRQPVTGDFHSPVATVPNKRLPL